MDPQIIQNDFKWLIKKLYYRTQFISFILYLAKWKIYGLFWTFFYSLGLIDYWEVRWKIENFPFIECGGKRKRKVIILIAPPWWQFPFIQLCGWHSVDWSNTLRNSNKRITVKHIKNKIPNIQFSSRSKIQVKQKLKCLHCNKKAVGFFFLPSHQIWVCYITRREAKKCFFLFDFSNEQNKWN